MRTEPQPDDRLAGLVRALVARAGGAEVIGIERIEGGRNNRAYRVDTGGRSLFLKAYHSDAADPRPRLQTEFDFLRFAWREGIRTVPQPIAADIDNNLGLYAFIEGRRPGAGEVAARHIEQAADFLAELKRHRATATAAALPLAAEACLSFRQHLDLIEARLERLQSIDDAEAYALVRQHFLPVWKEVSQRVSQRAGQAGILDERELPPGARCLSPSDFGFHNAIENSNGQLTFHDFEYAGWDDPAKLVCDFLCQPEVPIAEADAPFAVDRLLTACGAPSHRQRVDVLYPLYVAKWCCICLNEFLPVAARRRSFAARSSDAERQAQLGKVEAFVERLRRM